MELTGLRITARSEIKSGQMNVQKDWKGLNGAGAEGGGGFAGRWTRSWTSLARGECNPPPQLSPRSSSWPLLCHLSAGGEVAAREENSSSSWTIYFFRSRAAYIPMPISGRSPHQRPLPIPSILPVHKTRDCFAAALYRHFLPPANGAIICTTTGTGGHNHPAYNTPPTPHTPTTVLQRLLSPQRQAGTQAAAVAEMQQVVICCLSGEQERKKKKNANSVPHYGNKSRGGEDVGWW